MCAFVSLMFSFLTTKLTGGNETKRNRRPVQPLVSCSSLGVKPGAARTLRALADRPKLPPRSGVPPALRFSSPKYFPWNLKRCSSFLPLLLRCHCTCFLTIPSHQLPQLASSCHRFRGGDGIMIKQVIMPILVIEEPGMNRRDNRPYFQNPH